MKLSQMFYSLAFFVLALTSNGMAMPLAAPSDNKDATVAMDEPEPTTYLVTHEQMMHWIATTDAKLTFVGKLFNLLVLRSAQDTTVTYCSKCIDSVCVGPCTVYSGGAMCLNAPGMSCLAAMNNVGFCNHSGCRGSCNQLSTCRTHLDNGFCYTPGTVSILVSMA
ncbi:hypothetical protein V8D89_001258 [Ganoderma adspersum]